MKKLILLVCVASFGFVSCDKKDVPRNEVPSLVINAFEAKFPNAADVEWEKKGSDYEADFEANSIDHTALITTAGEIEKVKYDLLTAELPEEVKTAIEKNYPGETVDDADVLEIGGRTFYQIEFEGGFTDTHVIFDPSGTENPETEYWD